MQNTLLGLLLSLALTAGVGAPFCAAQTVRSAFVCALSDQWDKGERLEDPNAPHGFQERGLDVNPTKKYLVTPHKSKTGKRTATITVVMGGHRYTADDVSINQHLAEVGDYNFDADPSGGAKFHLEPGEAYHGYDFSLSPDERWLFVGRGGSNHLSFGTLFHRVHARDTRFVPVTPNGFRLDEAAVRVYAKQHHLLARKIGGGARYVHMEGWDAKQNRLLFSVAIAPKFFVDGRAWLSAYHLDTGKITIEKKEMY